MNWWELIGKLAALLALIAALLTIISLVWPSGQAQLVTRIAIHEYRYPPELSEFVEQVSSPDFCLKILTALAAVEPEIKHEELLSGEKCQALVRELLPDHLRGDNFYFVPELREFDNLLTFVIHNEGGGDADNVVLDSPFPGIAIYTTEKSTGTVKAVKESIELGVIRAGKSTTVYLWPHDSLYPNDIEETQVTFKSGTSKILIEKPVVGLIDALGYYVGLYVSAFVFAVALMLLAGWYITVVSETVIQKRLNRQSKATAAVEVATAKEMPAEKKNQASDDS